ncbi:AP-4 complex accessory subunit Tepsin isoform X1 [Triplophysa rosa]|uniref:AP-4 complex accessory subunit tepsin n=2 Tax=Triplophysa rosa TaxID=992332 RepID=A0A9W7THP0_TRIRA|nr:AP-4 complex accessory subunit Tepsin isoform X1 [Triplophysa rosa]KAI7796613.1 putative AP-4 complex accessory subunit tepsin [Triplophysa rosa]
MATLLERLGFLQKVPTLMRATADDESPCPGYLFEEISKISHESVGCCQCLLEYLLERLQVESCHVKLKVLKILLHLCSHGPPHFLTELRRNATFIQEVIVYSGPPDPIHGNAPFQKVRSSAQELASLLFNDTMSLDSGVAPCKKVTTSMGMGSASLRSGMQGFGYSPGKTESSGTTLLDKIQRAAEVVASAVLPPAEHPGIRLHDNHYHAVVAPSATVELAVPACAYNIQSHSHRASHRCPGQAGGGWEETDSRHSFSHNSSQENVPVTQTSVGRSSKSGGSGSHSGASRESGDLAERVEAMQLGDCGQEMALINSLTGGSKVFLSREESQHFIKECSTLNCEVVVELLSRKLQDHSQTVQMRALCALACLMSSDFLSLDHIFNITHKRLAQLSEGTAGPIANKATKLLRQFEALLGCVTHPRCDSAGRSASSSSSLSEQPSKSFTNPLLSGQLGETATSVIPSEEPPSRDRPQANITASESHIKREQEEERNSCKIQEPSRLSLFTGMELVNRSKPVCLVEPVPVETGVEATTDTDCASEKSSDRTIESPASSRPKQCKEQTSAFTFLNL